MNDPLAIEVEEDLRMLPHDKTTSLFRSGWSVLSTQKKNRKQEQHEHFRGLDEAEKAEHKKIFLKKMLTDEDSPLSAEERIWLRSPEVTNTKKDISKKHGIPEDDIYYVYKTNDGKEKWEAIGYRKQRSVRQWVINKIWNMVENDPITARKYNSRDDIAAELTRGGLTGRMTRFARLMEKAFGEGSMSELGIMGEDDVTPTLVQELLQKRWARTQQHQRKGQKFSPGSESLFIKEGMGF